MEHDVDTNQRLREFCLFISYTYLWRQPTATLTVNTIAHGNSYLFSLLNITPVAPILPVPLLLRWWPPTSNVHYLLVHVVLLSAKDDTQLSWLKHSAYTIHNPPAHWATQDQQPRVTHHKNKYTSSALKDWFYILLTVEIVQYWIFLTPLWDINIFRDLFSREKTPTLTDKNSVQ